MTNTENQNRPLLISIASVCHMTGLGRTTIYEEIRSGRLRSAKVGRRRVVASAWLEDWISQLS